jgi:hypothetical protein
MLIVVNGGGRCNSEESAPYVSNYSLSFLVLAKKIWSKAFQSFAPPPEVTRDVGRGCVVCPDGRVL